ncbi:Pentatricopeptide repeat-containing protein mitochondrial [Spatholobus suberectus]|nr:Pentatricopeptide repeat-containing protein mitochondrial [Spatholobus suberectus]
MFRKGSHLRLLPIPKKYQFWLPRNAVANAIADGVQQPSEATIARLVLESDPLTLPEALSRPSIHWTPDLVDKVLKRLWNHGPKALQFFKLLDRRHPTYVHASSGFDHAIDIAARMRDYPSAWALVARMRSLRRGPTPRTFAIIAERYASGGKPHRAVRAFLTMREHGCRQDLSSFNTVLDVLCKSKRVEMAHSLFRSFKSRFRADAVSYNIIANGYCHLRRTPMALRVLKEMVERGISPTTVTYNTLLKGYFRSNQIREAWEFYLEMKKRKCGIDVVTYTTVIHGFGVAGEVRKSRRVFSEMVKEGVVPSVATYNALIQVLCKKESVESAVAVFEEMLREGLCAPNLVTYNVVIRGLCHAGDMERALGFMGRMGEHGLRASVQTYNVVIRYFCDAGEIEKGLEMFGEMGNGACLPNLDTYNVLISAMFGRKKGEDLVVAGKLLMEMVDRGFLPRKFTFNRVLNGLVLTGNQEFAKEILRMQSKCGRVVRRLKL